MDAQRYLPEGMSPTRFALLLEMPYLTLADGSNFDIEVEKFVRGREIDEKAFEAYLAKIFSGSLVYDKYGGCLQVRDAAEADSVKQAMVGDPTLSMMMRRFNVDLPSLLSTL